MVGEVDDVFVVCFPFHFNVLSYEKIAIVSVPTTININPKNAFFDNFSWKSKIRKNHRHKQTHLINRHNYAIQNGIVSVVVPIDKMSLLVTVIFSYFAFHEKLSKKAFFGLILMVVGTLTMAIFS